MFAARIAEKLEFFPCNLMQKEFQWRVFVTY